MSRSAVTARRSTHQFAEAVAAIIGGASSCGLLVGHGVALAELAGTADVGSDVRTWLADLQAQQASFVVDNQGGDAQAQWMHSCNDAYHAVGTGSIADVLSLPSSWFPVGRTGVVRNRYVADQTDVQCCRSASFASAGLQWWR